MTPNYISILDKIFLIYLRFKFNLESCIFILKFNNPNQREFHASLYFLSIQITCNRSTGNSIIAELRLSDVVAVVQSFNCIQMLCDLMDYSPPDSLSMGFPRQEYLGNGFPFPSPGDLPNPGIKSVSPELLVNSLPLSSHLRSPSYRQYYIYIFK